VWRRWTVDGGWPPHGHDGKKVAGGAILASTHRKIPAERLPGLPGDERAPFSPLGASPWASPWSGLLNSIPWALDFQVVAVWQHGLGSLWLHLLVVVAGRVPAPRLSGCGPWCGWRPLQCLVVNPVG
jgi:hypothetical protein